MTDFAPGSPLTPRNAAKRCDDAKNNADLTRAGASEGTTRGGTGPVKVQSQMGLPPVATRAGSCSPRHFRVILTRRGRATETRPWLGGAIAGVLGGITTDRKINRVNEVIRGLAENLRDLESAASKEFVKTEEFEDLLEQTLRQVAAERNDDKRRMYRDFLVGVIRSPGEPYDEQRRFLRTLEELQSDHLRVLVVCRRMTLLHLRRPGSDCAWGAYREEITRFSRFVLSGRPGERDYWLGVAPHDPETVRRLGGPKPCIHGSDAAC